MVVVRKNISVEKGEKVLFDEIRYFFYITNDWVRGGRDRVLRQRPLQSGKPAGATARRRAVADGAGGQSGEQLGVHGDDGVGLEPESLVGVDAAGRAGTLAGEIPSGEAWVLRHGVQDVRECLCASALPDRADGPQVGVSAVGMEPAPTDLLPPGSTCCVVETRETKSESGCSDPPRHQERPRSKECAS